MEDQSPPPLPAAPRKSWWGRNWKWFLPVGCLGTIAIFACLIMLIIGSVFGLMKSSTPYKQGLSKAQAHPAVVKALGSPIEAGSVVSGNISVDGATGEANLAIPISGPNGSGTVYIEGTKSTGQWNYSVLAVTVDATGDRINLLE